MIHARKTVSECDCLSLLYLVSIVWTHRASQSKKLEIHTEKGKIESVLTVSVFVHSAKATDITVLVIAGTKNSPDWSIMT